MAEERAIEYAERRRAGSGRPTKPVERFEPEDFPRASKRYGKDDERIDLGVVKKKVRSTILSVGPPKQTRTVDNARSVAGTGALLPTEIAAIDNPVSSDLVLRTCHIGRTATGDRAAALGVRIGLPSQARGNCTSMSLRCIDGGNRDAGSAFGHVSVYILE